MLKMVYRVVYEQVPAHRQVLRFLVAGSIGAFVDLSTYYVLTNIVGFWYIASSAISFTVAFAVSFVLQKFWTFSDRSTDKIAKQSIIYLLVAICNLGVGTMLLYFFVDYLNVHNFASKILSSGIIAIESFFLYRYVVFPRGSTQSATETHYESNK